MTRRFWWWWAGINVTIGLLLPYLLGEQIARELTEYYRHHPLASTDGDSIGLPVATFALTLWSVQLVATAVAMAWHLIKGRRRPTTSIDARVT